MPDENKNRSLDWSLVKSILVSLLVSALVAFFIQPWATRYWQSPDLKIIGAQPVDLFEDTKPELSPSDHKMFNHRLAMIFKVENSSSSPAIINTAMIEGCVALPDPFAGESSLPQDQQIDLDGKLGDEIAKRHEHTVQRIRVAGRFQNTGDTAIVVGSHATEYVGMWFPTSTGPYYSEIGSASLTGECSKITTPNKWPNMDQLLENAMPRGAFPASLRKEFYDQRLEVQLFAANGQIAVMPKQLKSLVRVSWKDWPELLLPQMYENSQTMYPALRNRRD